jgi:hypothetical protein
LIFQSPLAAIANGTDTEVSVTIPAQANPVHASNVGGVILSWQTSTKIVFQGGVNAIASGADTLVTLSGDSFDASQYYTKTQVDALILAAVTPPSPLLFDTGSTVYTFDGNQSASIEFDPTSSNPAGSLLSQSFWDTGNAPFTLALAWKANSHHAGNMWMRAQQGQSAFARMFIMPNQTSALYVGGDTPWNGLNAWSPGGYSVGVWYHWTMIWYGSTNSPHAKAYVNGVEQTASDLADDHVVMDSSSNPLIGHGEYGGAFQGQIKHVKFFNVTKTDTEVQTLSQAAIG